MTPTEVAQIMSEILEIDEVAPDQPFFEAGGNSFLALTLIRRIQERAGAQLRMIDIIRNPTPAGVSGLVGRALARDGRVVG